MKKIRSTYIICIVSLLLQLFSGGSEIYAQKVLQQRMDTPKDSLKTITKPAKDVILADSLDRLNKQELDMLEAPVDTAILVRKTDSIQKKMPQPKKTLYSKLQSFRMASHGIPWSWTNL